jgi:Cytochrome P450
MDRLQKEIGSVMGDSEFPTREKIKKMPYLACVIKESQYLMSSFVYSQSQDEFRPSSLSTRTAQ